MGAPPAETDDLIVQNATVLRPFLALQRRPEAGLIVTDGRLARHKGLDDLLRAAAGLETPWRLELSGAEDHEERVRLDGIAHALGIEDRVVFKGPYTDEEHLQPSSSGPRCASSRVATRASGSPCSRPWPPGRPPGAGHPRPPGGPWRVAERSALRRRPAAFPDPAHRRGARRTGRRAGRPVGAAQEPRRAVRHLTAGGCRSTTCTTWLAWRRSVGRAASPEGSGGEPRGSDRAGAGPALGGVGRVGFLAERARPGLGRRRFLDEQPEDCQTTNAMTTNVMIALMNVP